MKEIILTDKIYDMKCPYNHATYLYKTRLMDELVKLFCPHCGASMIKKKLRTIGYHTVSGETTDSE